MQKMNLAPTPPDLPSRAVHVEIAGNRVSVPVFYEVVDVGHLTIRVKTIQDALVVCYYYRYNHGLEIIEPADHDGYLVVVKKK